MRAEGAAQVVEHCEVLNSNPSTAKKKRNNAEMNILIFNFIG
jgi:hypothetical protein